MAESGGGIASSQPADASANERLPMSKDGPNPLPAGGPPGSSAPGAGHPAPDPTPPAVPKLSGRGPRPGSALQEAAGENAFTPEQRLLVLDAWRRSGLPAGDSA